LQGILDPLKNYLFLTRARPFYALSSTKNFPKVRDRATLNWRPQSKGNLIDWT